MQKFESPKSRVGEICWNISKQLRNLVGKSEDGSLIKEFEASHGTVPWHRTDATMDATEAMHVGKTPRWPTCGICTFVVRTKHEGMQGNDLRVERMVDYWHLVFVFDGISMYLLVMQYRIGLLWNLQGSGNCPLFCG